MRVYAEKSSDPTWIDIVKSFKETFAELKGARLLRMLSRGNLFNSFQIAYMGILWKDLSIDLVAASLRQREFARKITSDGCGIDVPSALFLSVTRYHKFLLLMKRKPKDKKVALVPTLDIDLCWHTHQLDAVSYRQWCIEHLGIAINHDDTVAKESVDTGFQETNRLWLRAYREPYTSDNDPEASSRRRSSGGLLGVFKRKKGEKLPAGKKLLSESLMKVTDKPVDTNEEGKRGYLSVYPYWFKTPFGWNYPAACASGNAGKARWAASVDPSPGISFYDGELNIRTGRKRHCKVCWLYCGMYSRLGKLAGIVSHHPS